MLFFVRNSLTTCKVCAGALSWCNNLSPFFHILGHLCLTFSLSKISHLQFDQVEQTPYAQFLECQKNDQHWLDVAANLACFFRLQRGRLLPLQRLLLCFRVIIIQPWFITSYDPGQEVRIMSNCFYSSVHTWTRWSRWSLLKPWGTNFAAILLMFISSARMRWHDPYDSPTQLQTSWIVCLLSSRIIHTLRPSFPELCIWTVDQNVYDLPQIPGHLWNA